ncbi:MAG: hypothetical protein H6550_08825 [Chitinophagales bacterium]|nr:hypothetical protein [Chitinophagales bacterium]
MNKIYLSALLLINLLAGTVSSAQKIKLLSGKLDMLKGVESINVDFDYSKMGVGKFATEAEYIKTKKADYNKKEEGKGDEWEKAWVADRKNRFQPKFEELFNEHSGMTCGDIPEAKYTLIFKTKYTEPGYNVYVSRKNARVDGEAVIVETANPGKILARMSVLNCQGRTFGGNDYDSGTRLQESYAVAGKGLGKFFKGKLKK